MRYLPIGVDLKDKPCLVVGGGEVASRKIIRLLDAGAIITVVALELNNSAQSLFDEGKISVELRDFSESDLAGKEFVVAATSDNELNKKIAQAAKQKNLWCNTAENIDENSVIFPSLVRRDPVLISVSSDGSSPVLARVLSAQIDAFVPASMGKLAVLAQESRQKVKDRFSSLDLRRRFWNNVMTGKVAQLLHLGNEKEARAELQRQLASETSDDHSQGEVYLVGAGPGDPDLLTIRALRLIQRAEVVLHDRLVSDGVLSLCPSSAEFIYVGKERSSHAMRQQKINDTLVVHAKLGKRVLRLKGGDPFIFGRGGEEIQKLAEQGVAFQVVPGITAASGCASYAGIPLTHRDYAQSCVFVTGQLKNGSIDLPWKSLANPTQTIVCYMGLVGLPIICHSLIDASLPADTPAALIEQGTTAQQRVITATLATLPEIVAESSVKAPTLLIIGQVVRLRSALDWLDSKNLPT